MNAKQLLHQEKLNKWTAMFHEQHESGLSVKDWCTQNNVSPYAFFYWKRVAKEAYVQSLIPESFPSHPACAGTSHELYNLSNLRDHAASITTPSAMTLTLPGIRIEFDSSASDETVLRVIKAVRHV